MKQVEIQVFNLAKTSLNEPKIRQWLQLFDTNYDEIIGENPPSMPSTLVGLAGKRCYLSFKVGINPNVTKIREDWVKYLDNVLSSGHGSVLEHATYTWAIEGVSRVFTAEMNRHRAGVAISEGSMRYIRMEDIPFWMPLSLQPSPCPLSDAEYDELENARSNFGDFDKDRIAAANELGDRYAEWEEIEKKKQVSQAIFERAFTQAQENYIELQRIWADALAPKSPFKGKKQITSMMRRIIPIGVATGAVYTLNFRALRHVMSMRWEEAAEEEICFVWSQIGKMMIEAEPEIFGDFVEENGFIRPKYWKV